MKNLGAWLAALIALAILLSLSIYTVHMRQAAMVFQFGEIVAVQRTPGLYFKVPLVQNVRFFDMRIQTLDAADPERFITSEKKNVLVDYYVKWRINEVRRYYVTVAGDESRARIRLSQTVNDLMRAEFGKRTVDEVVSGERDRIMDILRKRADAEAEKFGVDVLDVRIKRIDLPAEVSESVYRRMEAERKRVANELRSTGSAEGEKIRADADRQREILLAEAYRTAQRLKGEGDARATEIYGSAYSKSPEFYGFYRSLEAYRRAFSGKDDVLILDPSSEFFKYLQSPRGSTPAGQ